jgi:hypothetical protein
VDDRAKKELWVAVSSHFNLSPDPTEDNEALREQVEKKVREWDLKKMATQFLTFKKILYIDYIKKGRTLEFTRPLEKIKYLWAEFVEYKKSAKDLARSEKNAAKNNITINWGQVATGLSRLSGNKPRPP